MRHHRILGAVGTLVLWAAGCAVPAPTRNEELLRVERQLDELYQPLLALVRESHASVQDFMKTQLGRDWIFPLEKDEEVKLWLEKAEGDLMPRNERMVALIRAKRDLVDGPDLPPSWKALLEHQDGWRALHEKWKRDHLPYSWHSPTAFPKRLEAELEAAIETLGKRRTGLKTSS
ncbi:MAG TPA: hypothetical protein VKW04_15180 [Planctomycetota bacterium]|jgi:hypothetical protein|nr:hypothetical protein [Planctomycetota bacterium]